MKRLTKRQKQALGMIECATDTGDVIWITNWSSMMSEGEAFIHRATAKALERRGLIVIDNSVFDDATQAFFVAVDNG